MPQTMTYKAYAKINLALDVTGKRADGYHFVRMVMETIDLYDTLRVTESDEPIFRLTTDAETLPADRTNLVIKAAEAMKEHFHFKGGAVFDLEKRIPMAAGLAGGSADAAAAMHALNALYDLNAGVETLSKIALTIGADVPYCLRGGSMLAEGIGEALTPLPAPPPCEILLAKPFGEVSTKEIYTALDTIENPEHPDIDACAAALSGGDIKELSSSCGNILEAVTMSKMPVIRELTEIMYDYGAYKAMMSGSGPTVFGLFPSGRDSEITQAYRTLKSKHLTSDLLITSFYNGAGI